MFTVQTWATMIFLTSQMSGIIRFFLSKNLRIAKVLPPRSRYISSDDSQDRAWELTIVSRGKPKDFWGPYTEEWQIPPKLQGGEDGGVGILERWMGKWWARLIINRFILFPLQLYPFVGMAISAWMRAYGTSRYLHSKVGLPTLQGSSILQCDHSTSRPSQ